jgi:hypothetical protein
MGSLLPVRVLGTAWGEHPVNGAKFWEQALKDAKVYEHSPRGDPWQAIFNSRAAIAVKTSPLPPLIRRSSQNADSLLPSGASPAGWPRRMTKAAEAAEGIVPLLHKAHRSSVRAADNPPRCRSSRAAIVPSIAGIVIRPAKAAGMPAVVAAALALATEPSHGPRASPGVRATHLLQHSSTTPKRWILSPVLSGVT